MKDLYISLNKSPMVTSSNGNIFRVTGPLCGEFTGPGEFPAQRPVNKREAWDLSRHRAHCDVIVILHANIMVMSKRKAPMGDISTSTRENGFRWTIK